MLVGSLLSFALVVISDMLRTNRTLMEEALERMKLIQYAPERMKDPRGLAQEAGAAPLRESVAATATPSAIESDEVPATKA